MKKNIPFKAYMEVNTSIVYEAQLALQVIVDKINPALVIHSDKNMVEAFKLKCLLKKYVLPTP